MSGRELSLRFYREVVHPLLGHRTHAAALLGEGSQVLGFDDEVSTDHDFGPRVQVFVAGPADAAEVTSILTAIPTTFAGYPIGARDQPPAVEVTTPAQFFADRLGVDPGAGFTLGDWLLTPTQVLATLVDGLVFSDPGRLLESRRTRLRWYPDDVWRYVLAAQWLRISQEQAFLGRTGARGDDLGSRVIAARLVREQVRLAFLVARRWAPYPKWLGTAFTQLPLARLMGPDLRRALATDDWRERERAVCAASSSLLEATNDLRLAPPVDPTPHAFFSRDIRVVDAEGTATGLLDAVTDPEVSGLVDRLGQRGDAVPRLPGAIDQAVDSTDVLSNPARCRAAGALLGLTRPGSLGST